MDLVKSGANFRELALQLEIVNRVVTVLDLQKTFQILLSVGCPWSLFVDDLLLVLRNTFSF